MRRRVVALSGAVAATVLLVAGLGCEAIVSDSISGVVQCVDGPGVCPSGQSCVDGTCQVCTGAACSSHDGGTDGSHDARPDRDVTVHDVAPDMNHDEGQDGPTTGQLGSTCSSNAACESGVCGNALLLTSYVQTPDMASVCTKPCCTSADCDDPKVKDYVCFPSVGGNYCVDPMWINLDGGVGMGAPGSDCTQPSNCRSGVCTVGKCQDTCCLDGQCTNGSVCQYSTLDTTPSFNCGSSAGSVQQGGNCGYPDYTQCESNACLTVNPYLAIEYCLGPCCNDGECNKVSGLTGDPKSICNWNDLNDKDAGTIMLRSCSVAINKSGLGFGAACSANSGCATDLCYQKVCTSPCCGVGDCPGGYTCSYASFTLASLTTVDLQVCVPSPK